MFNKLSKFQVFHKNGHTVGPLGFIGSGTSAQEYIIEDGEKMPKWHAC